MDELVLEEIYKSIKNLTPEYAEFIENTYVQYLTYSQLPLVFRINSLDMQTIPTHTKQLFTNSYNILNSKKSIIVQLDTYKPAGFITAVMLRKYFKQCILDDEHINTILYVDTNLLMLDYKKLIDRYNKEDDVKYKLTHSLDLLYRDIFEADYVFWDKWTMINSEYDVSKLYEILSIRYRNGLGNAFYINTSEQNLTKFMSVELRDVMDIEGTDAKYSLQNDRYNYTKGS